MTITLGSLRFVSALPFRFAIVSKGKLAAEVSKATVKMFLFMVFRRLWFFLQHQ